MRKWKSALSRRRCVSRLGSCPGGTGRARPPRRRSGDLGGQGSRHDHLSVRHLPWAGRQGGLVQRGGQDRLRCKSERGRPRSHPAARIRQRLQPMIAEICGSTSRARPLTEKLSPAGARTLAKALTGHRRSRQLRSTSSSRSSRRLRLVMAGAPEAGHRTAEHGAEAVLTSAAKAAQQADRRARDDRIPARACSTSMPEASADRDARADTRRARWQVPAAVR